MSTSRLPQIDSIEELARFWDTHEITEFEDELEEVSERVFQRDTDITVHLEVGDVKALRELARLRGIPDSELIREWVLEKIHAT